MQNSLRPLLTLSSRRCILVVSGGAHLTLLKDSACFTFLSVRKCDLYVKVSAQRCSLASKKSQIYVLDSALLTNGCSC